MHIINSDFKVLHVRVARSCKLLLIGQCHRIFFVENDIIQFYLVGFFVQQLVQNLMLSKPPTMVLISIPTCVYKKLIKYFS